MKDSRDQRRKVFIVDDHALVREWLTNLINQQNDLAVCGEAGAAAEALQAITAAKPEVAIVDISLKDSSGIELIKDLKRSYPSLAVLVLSMHDESLYAERALLAGAKGYIMKRETTRKVVEALRRVLDGKFYISETISEMITERFIQAGMLAPRSSIQQLSDRELAVFDLLGEAHGSREIAEALGISIKTVQAYCARIKEKLNLHTGTELLREALRHKASEDSTTNPRS